MMLVLSRKDFRLVEHLFHMQYKYSIALIVGIAFGGQTNTLVSPEPNPRKAD